MWRLLLILTLTLMLSIGISAQVDDDNPLTIRAGEFIAYNRIIDGQKQYVMRFNDEIITFTLPQNTLPDNRCAFLSKNWRYYFVFDRGGNKIQVFHPKSNRLIAENSWDGLNFNICNGRWLEDDKTIYILKSTETYEAYQFYFDGHDIVQLSNEIFFDFVTLPPLPNRLADDDNFVWLSPDPNIYLYEACPTIETSQSIHCNGGSDLVLYDISQNQVIENISEHYPRLDKRYLSGALTARFNREEPISKDLVAWSYDARYLAFCDCKDNQNGFIFAHIVIYDRLTDTYYEPSFGSTSNMWRKFSWSPNGYILALWHIGAGEDSEFYTYTWHGDLNQLVLVNMDTNVDIKSQASFDIISDRVVWSPDNRAVAFHGKERINPTEPFNFFGNDYLADLIMLDTMTGEHIVIDENVTYVHMWRSICDDPTPHDAECEDS